MKKGIFLALGAALTVAGVLGVNKLNSEELASNDLLMENVEALSASENNPEEGDMWFSRLNDVECEMVKIMPAGGGYYNGIWFAGGAKITISGHRWKCERALTVNTCHFTNETSCSI